MAGVNIRISDHAREMMEEIGIKEEEVQEVIDFAESEGKKICKKGEERYLGKKEIGGRKFYADYSPSDDGFEVHTTYALRFEIEEV